VGDCVLEGSVWTEMLRDRLVLPLLLMRMPWCRMVSDIVFVSNGWVVDKGLGLMIIRLTKLKRLL